MKNPDRVVTFVVVAYCLIYILALSSYTFTGTQNEYQTSVPFTSLWRK